jgi:hypothetical protein
MLFFLDTNVFYGDWFARGANFRYLFHFINNEGHDLLVSKAVLQEAENIQARELASAVAEAKKNLVNASKLNGASIVAESPNFKIKKYDLLSILKEKVESVTVVDYQSIPHSVVVNRALKRIRPFQENEKGYRDTLIWLSLLDHLQSSLSSEIVAFISANKSDFLDPTAKPIAFHSDLLEDLESLPSACSIQPFISLFEFVDKSIDKHEHALDHTKAEDAFGTFIEEQGVAFLTTVRPTLVASLQSVLTPGVNALLNASSITAEVTEGIEDLDVLSTSDLGDGDVYVSCMYSLRRVQIAIRIPLNDYLLYQAQIESANKFYERDIEGDQIQLTTTIRPYFTVSFVHSVVDESSKDFSVDDFFLR